METIKNIQVKLVKGVAILIGTLSIVSFMVFEEPKAFIVGLIFGAIIGILNFRLMYLTLTKAVKMLPHRAQGYAVGNYLARYAITGSVLYVSIKADHINVVGVLIGLFALKLVIIKDELFHKDLWRAIFKRKEEK